MKAGCVKSQFIVSHNSRFEGKFYMNENAFNSMLLERNIKFCNKLGEVANVFNPPVFKRQFCKETERAVLYYQSADVRTLIRGNQYIFKGQVESLGLIVNQGDLLVTGFGTVIGDVCIASSIHNKACFANNVCRVIVNEDSPKGFIYAVLASKYGKSQLNNNASGTAVRYIEAPRIRETLIPKFSSELVSEINKLISDSIEYKEHAITALDKAKSILSNYLNLRFEAHKYKTDIVSSKNIWNSLQHRLDPPALMNDGVITMSAVCQKFACKTIGEINCNVYRPGIFKRSYVNDGLPYIKGSEIFLTNPFRRCQQLSRTRTPFIEEMSLKNGQILITCAGSVGDIKMITQDYEDKESIGSQDIIRLISDDELFTREYMFIYLQMPFVYEYMQSMKYGSVIERIEPFHVESIPVVTPTKELSEEITAIIKQYMDCTYRAFNAEEKAIQLVEQEIEKWNK